MLFYEFLEKTKKTNSMKKKMKMTVILNLACLMLWTNSLPKWRNLRFE
jgi:hypothetical protein